jgi:hypothetical protein
MEGISAFTLLVHTCKFVQIALATGILKQYPVEWDVMWEM